MPFSLLWIRWKGLNEGESFVADGGQDLVADLGGNLEIMSLIKKEGQMVGNTK